MPNFPPPGNSGGEAGPEPKVHLLSSSGQVALSPILGSINYVGLGTRPQLTYRPLVLGMQKIVVALFSVPNKIAASLIVS